jgi:hypothetical protein
MGKLRLNCPNCGKAVAVSETAKKARCPGCKKVMDVAAALAGDLDPSTELSAEPKAAPEPQAAAEPQAAPESTEGEAGAEEGDGPAKPKRRSSRIARAVGSGSTRKSGRKSDRAEGMPEREAPPPPTFDLPGGAQPWMIIAGVAVIGAVVLWLVANVNPIAAVGIVSGVGIFIDAALMRITRISPSAKGWGSMPMVWGLIGFVPVIGVAVYALLRAKLVENSPEDIATPDMDEDDMAFEGKVRPPSVVSVGIVLVIALAVGAGMFFQQRPSTWVEVGTSVSEKRGVLSGQSKRKWYNMGKLYAVFHAQEPLADIGELSFEVLKIGRDGTSTSVGSDAVTANVASRERLGWFAFEVTESGRHRLLVKDADGSSYAKYDFRILGKGSR